MPSICISQTHNFKRYVVLLQNHSPILFFKNLLQEILKKMFEHNVLKNHQSNDVNKMPHGVLNLTYSRSLSENVLYFFFEYFFEPREFYKK